MTKGNPTKKGSFRKIKKNTFTKNCIEYKQKRAKAHKIIKETKKKCWQEYISKINTITKPKTKWKMVRKISGKHNPPLIKHLFIKNSKITEIKVIANKFAKIFSDNSSSKHNSKQFQIIKKNREKYKINLNSKSQEIYNGNFSMTELKTTTEKSHNSAVGPDEVHYSFLN